MPLRGWREPVGRIRLGVGAMEDGVPEAEGYFGQDVVEREDPVEGLYEAMRAGRILQVQVIGLEPWGREGAGEEVPAADGTEAEAGPAGPSGGVSGERPEALIVSVDGVVGWRGVVPPDEIGERIGRTLGSFLGQWVAVQVLRIDRGERTVHFSRRRAKEAMAARTLRRIGVGQRHKAVVQRVGLNGAALDVGGVSAFLPAGEVSWSYVERLEDVLRPGQAFDVEVLEVRTDEEVGAHPGRARLVVSRKRCGEDPWADVDRRLRPGQYRVGRIDGVRVTPAGGRQAFVEVEPGLVILALVRFEGEVNVGDEAFVRIIRVDGENRRAVGVLTRVQASVSR